MSRGVGVTSWLIDSQPAWAPSVFELLSLPGDLLVLITTLGLCYLVSVREELKTGRPSTDTARLCPDRTAAMIAIVLGGLALIVLLESLFGLSRPPTDWHAVSASEYGFPSGHTMAATILWGAIAGWATVGSQYHRYGVVTIIVSLVGFSRLALGVHYVVDVVAGVGFGVGYLLISSRIAQNTPARAFLVALLIAGNAVVVTGGNERALLALGGTIGSAVGWWAIERPVVKQQLRHHTNMRLRGKNE